LSRPIIARLRSESHLRDRITLRGGHQRLLQQNLPLADSCVAAISPVDRSPVEPIKDEPGSIAEMRSD
jgi:hypothetical protein